MSTKDLQDASAEDLATLFAERGHGLPREAMDAETEPLGSLEVVPKAFQFRQASHRKWEKEHHIRMLVQALGRQDEMFDPIEILPVDGHRLVLDGHCRLKAYRSAGLDECTAVPVAYFTGSFAEAIKRPAEANSKEKLPLTQEEKLEGAWRLAIFDERRGNYSLRDIARATGAGKSTVGKMRRYLREDDDLSFDPRERTWKEVKRGEREERETDPAWEEKRSRVWAKRLRNGLGPKPGETPQCLMRALELAYPQVFPEAIPRHWATDSGIVEELCGEDAPSFDF